MLQGYFVDVGAGDGVFNSNTLFLERQRCWKGIAVEPAANEYPKLERQRPGSTVVSSPPDQVPVLQDVASTGTASHRSQLCMRTAGSAAAVTHESCSQSMLSRVLQVRPAAMALAATQPDEVRRLLAGAGARRSV